MLLLQFLVLWAATGSWLAGLPERQPDNVDRWQNARLLPHCKRTNTHRGDTINPSATMTPAWIVCAWPPVLWQASSAPELHLIHLGTRVLSFGDEMCRCSGQTLWGEASEERAAGVAWDWVELKQGVFAMADPLGLITNLRLLDERGEALTSMQVAVQLHQLVHMLPWQTEVQRAMHQPS